MRYVYLAGPISGKDYREATDWREWVRSHLAPGLVGVSPMRMKEWYKDHDPKSDTAYEWLRGIDEAAYLLSGETHAIGHRDFMDVKRADMVMANLLGEEGSPSRGTDLEIGWAIAFRTPVVIVTQDEAIIKHPLFRTHVAFIVPTLQMGVVAVNATMGPYAGVTP